jgi:dienelactone hydrolase
MHHDLQKPLVRRLSRLFEIGSHPLAEIERATSSAGNFAVETIRFATSKGESVRGILTRPKSHRSRRPAVLHIHAHGNRYNIGADELLLGRPALQGPPGPVFAHEGYVTLCIDLPCFGERASASEGASAKAALWHGRSLAGQMLGELSSALDWLAAREDIDPSRIGCYGISMGATLGYWLAAVDRRISALAQLCCFADFDELIATGAHDRHGIYLTVPGLLDVAGNGRIAGLVAPRPQLICLGDQDELTPPPAVDAALTQTQSAYRKAGVPERLRLLREADTGHCESPAMRETVLGFFREYLAKA